MNLPTPAFARPRVESDSPKKRLSPGWISRDIWTGGDQSSAACLPASSDWKDHEPKFAKKVRPGIDEGRREALASIGVTTGRPLPNRQAGTARDLLRLIEAQFELNRTRALVMRLRDENLALKRELTAHHLSGPRIDLGNEVNVHGVSVPERLEGIIWALQDSRPLLELPDDWDDNGALGYSEQTWERTADILVRTAMILANEHGVIVSDVEILPGASGSLNIDWRIGDRELLITVPEDPDGEVLFYGDDGNGRQKLKGTLGAPKVDRMLSTWLAE